VHPEIHAVVKINPTRNNLVGENIGFCIK